MRRSEPVLHGVVATGIASIVLAASFGARAQEAAPEPAQSPEAAQAGETAEEEILPPAPPPPEAKSLDELLELVRQGFQAERAENARREEEFRRAKVEQARLLEQSEATLAREEARSQRLEETYNTNEQELATLEQRLTERLGQLGELFGVVRQVSTDTSGQVWDSLTSAELGPR